jgi:hypothetical protein
MLKEATVSVNTPASDVVMIKKLSLLMLIDPIVTVLTLCMDVVKMDPPKKLTKKDPTVLVNIQSSDVVKMASPLKLMLPDPTVVASVQQEDVVLIKLPQFQKMEFVSVRILNSDVVMTTFIIDHPIPIHVVNSPTLDVAVMELWLEKMKPDQTLFQLIMILHVA